MYIKKILASLTLVSVMAVSAAMFAAYEAHVINVTAHIENALTVHPDEIAFGTVFPQEYTERDFTVELSTSFLAEDRVYDVEYVIKQKPKCECDYPEFLPDGTSNPDYKMYCVEGQYAPVDYATHECPVDYTEMLSLCPYLSKMPKYEEAGDIGIPSYYVDESPAGPSANDYCTPLHNPDTDIAYGYLDKNMDDIMDEWVVDLKVPPFDGYVGQDWPENCPVLGGSPDGQDFGCDLWIEITGISERVQVAG